MVLLFWLATFLLVYHYAGYPALLYIATIGRPLPPRAVDFRPTISIIIAAYNEQAWIEARIRNALATDYPRERLQVIVVSDGSDDDTLALANGIDDERLQVIDVQPRQGKANALNQGIAQASGAILVLTDANVFCEPAAIARLAEHFADPACGYVTAHVELQPLDTAEPLGEGVYMRLERFLQARESLLATVVGTDGALFAARGELVPVLPAGIVLDDFFIATHIAAAGHAVRYEAEARAVERVPASVAQEFRRKVRIAAGCFQVLPFLEFLRYPWRQPLLALLFVSHKLLRWVSPWLLLVILVSSATLAPAHPLFLLVVALQAGLYGLALIGWLCPQCRRWPGVYVPYYFAAVNLAFAMGLVRQLTRGQTATWQRVDRADQSEPDVSAR